MAAIVVPFLGGRLGYGSTNSVRAEIVSIARVALKRGTMEEHWLDQFTVLLGRSRVS
jgi:hypothetical protein